MTGISLKRGKEATLLPHSWEGNKGQERVVLLCRMPDRHWDRGHASGHSEQQGGRRELIVPVLLGEGCAQNPSVFGGCIVGRGWGAAGTARGAACDGCGASMPGVGTKELGRTGLTFHLSPICHCVPLAGRVPPEPQSPQSCGCTAGPSLPSTRLGLSGPLYIPWPRPLSPGLLVANV